MATAQEKQAIVAAKQAETQAVIAQRSRKEAGGLPAPKMRASGDLSRYNVGYTDDPYAIPFEDLSSPGALPPPERVDVTPPPAQGMVAPPRPPRAPTPTGGGSTQPRAPRPTAPRTRPVAPRTQPGTTNVQTPYGGYRRVSEGKVPVQGALYETNPGSVKKPQTTGRISVGGGSIGLDPSGKGGKKGGSYQPPKPKGQSTGRISVGTKSTIALSPTGSGAKKGGSFVTQKPESAKSVKARATNNAKPARAVSKAVKK